MAQDPEMDSPGAELEQPDEQLGKTPLNQLGILAKQTVSYHDQLRHLEIYTRLGLLAILWHGPTDANEVVVCVGGATGGLLGPDGGLYHQLGESLSKNQRGVVRVSYRQPNNLEACVHDTLATIELAALEGAERFILLGHSFGGAVVIQAAALVPAATVLGVVTFATQAGGCEPVETLSDRDLVFFHGTADQILPHYSSQMVHMLAGAGEVVLLDGADHLLHPAGQEILEDLLERLPAIFDRARAKSETADTEC